MLFDITNLPYWIFLGSGVFLFLFVILSGGGDDDFEIDSDTDVDTGNSLLDFDAEAEADFSAGQVLGWIGIGKAPLVLLIATDLCLWGLIGWMLNVFLGSRLGFWRELITLIVSLAIALGLGSLIARPIGRIFAAFTEDASSDRLVGCIGTVVSATIPLEGSGKIGQIDVRDTANNLITVSAILPSWAQISLRRGAKVLVIDRQTAGYYVVAKDSPDQIHWLNGDTNKPLLPPDDSDFSHLA